MPTPSLLSEEQWKEVEIASVAGVPDDKLERDFGISQNAIRQRRKRFAWPTRKRMEIEQEKARQALRNKEKEDVQSSHGAETIVTHGHSTPKAGEVIGKTIAEMGEVYPLLASRYVLSKLEETVTKDLLPAPDSWKAMAVADSILRKNLGLDKPETQVNLSLWSSQSIQTERDVTPSSALDVEDDLLK